MRITAMERADSETCESLHMRDPFFWSIPVGRFFGITVRVHLLFPMVALGLILRLAVKYPDGVWVDGVMLTCLLFVSVLLHEFGHCFCGALGRR